MGGPRQAQAKVGRRRPSFGPGQKAGDLLGRDLDADRRSQRVRVRLAQRQLLRTDLQQVARRAESRVGQRQHPTRGDCQSQGRWQAEHEERDHIEWSRLVEMMRVIEHQNGRCAPRPDRLDESWQQRRFERATGRPQEPQQGGIERFHAVEGCRDPRDQPDRVVVAFFEGDIPDVRQVVGPLTQQRGLAVAGWRHDGHDGRPVGTGEEIREPRARHHRRRRRRQRELRAEDGRSRRSARGHPTVLPPDPCRHRPSIGKAPRGRQALAPFVAWSQPTRSCGPTAPDAG